MDIVVHGTKGGRKIFTPKKLGGLLDISADASERSAMGKEAFAIRFVENNIIFSKYKIVRDVLGAKRTGFIGFSLFLSNDEKLSGSQITALLNRVSKAYCDTYIPKNDNNLKDDRENWTFVYGIDGIEEKYRPKVKPISPDDVETLQSGTKDDAFIYYKDDTELQKYFDMPYEDEYKPYRQVLFVKEDLKGRPENPLKAIRHSEDNLTGKIDLENPKYKLIYGQTTKTGVQIEVKVKGKIHDGKSKVRKKDELEISWSKPYYKTVTKRGKWTDIKSTFIEANDSLQRVSIKEIGLKPETKEITFDIKPYEKGIDVSNAEIRIGTGPWQKIKGSRYEHTFQAEDIGKQWTVTAKKGRNFESIEQSFVPKDQKTVEITLHEHKTVKFTGRQSNQYCPDIKITIPEKKVKNNNNSPKVIFKDTEIDREFTVTATINGKNGNLFEGKQTFIPRDHDVVTIKLKEKKYYIHAGEHGCKSELGIDYYSFKEDGSKPKKGWKFTGFKLNENKTDDYGTLVAQYKKKSFFARSEGLITSVAAVLVLCFGIWFFKFGTTEKNITAYVEGTKLFDKKLTELKNQWITQKPEIKIEKKDSTAYKHWEKVSKSIDSAIAKRNLINSLNFDSLKTLRYSAKQQKFGDAIKNMDSAQYGALKEKLKNQNISSLTLNQIAEAVSAVSGATENNITAYVEGTELFDAKLAAFKSQWDLQKNEVKTGRIRSMLGLGNSTAYKHWEKVSKSINSAIEKRRHIDSLNFDSLKKLRYSANQRGFEEAIKNIDSTKYGALKDKLKDKDFPSWDLNQIADTIRVFLNPPVVRGGEDQRGNTKGKNVEGSPKGSGQNPVGNAETTTENTAPPQDIGKDLQSGTVSIEQLEEWQRAGMDKYKKSIALYLSFWGNVSGSSSQKEDFDQLLKEVNNDKILKTSALETFFGWYLCES